ncbi:MAG: acyltransferase family protein, partial [Verrucomicrobiota bacterium]
MTLLKYRADIDGLRAVAVLGVIIYHAWPWALPGGFIGVDIFFVISGYLISGILYKGLKANGGEGEFSFAEFYARRIRRLFPALITVLLLCLGYGWVILLPDEFQQLGKHVAAGTLFIQNFVFWQESGYFDTAANLKPLLHLWSLAVEEQFYIFFPPLLLLIWKRKWPLVIIMGVLLIASMILNLVMSVQDSVPAFFLTPYRAWEFLGGSLLAWWHYDKGHEEDVPVYREALAWGGLILLGLGFTFIHKSDPYPGWRAILPVAGTLMLMEGGRGALVNRKLLSNPAIVWIGLISYPLYLFHWPALSFVHIVKGENPKPVYIADALILSLLLSIFTYYFIERKIRHNKSCWTIPVLVGAFLLTGLIGLLVAKDVISSATLPSSLINVQLAINDTKSSAGLERLSGKDKILVYRGGGSGRTTLFIGDSNMRQYAPRIVELLKESHDSRGVLFITAGGVPTIPGITSPERPECGQLMPRIYREIKDNTTIDRVVIAAAWHNYFIKKNEYGLAGVSLTEWPAKKAALEALGSFIQSLVNDGKKVTLILSVPTGEVLN